MAAENGRVSILGSKFEGLDWRLSYSARPVHEPRSDLRSCQGTPRGVQGLNGLHYSIVAMFSAKINLEFVLGNKVMVGTVSANREHFCQADT